MKLEKRLKKAQADGKAFQARLTSGGGAKADGSKVTGYADAQSILPANSPHRKSVDRVVFALLRETELIRSKNEVQGKLSNAMDAVNRTLRTYSHLHIVAARTATWSARSSWISSRTD